MFSQDTISQMLKSGELKGLVVDNEFGYIPLRLTGTGIRERKSSDEKVRVVNRNLQTFTTPELMKLYANLPVVLDHPKNENGEAVRAGYENGTFVGNTIDSYVNGEEIWVIARLQEKSLIDYLKENNDLSTSPHFVTEEVLENGIFQEVPIKVNSLAIVSKGFWDATSSIPAIDNSEVNLIKEEIIMSEAEKKDSVMEQEVSKAEKADEKTTEEKVADLEEHEAKEAESFEKLAEDHKELEKGDSMEEEKKTEKADEAVISNINQGAGDSWSEEGKKEAHLSITATGDSIQEAKEKLEEAAAEIGKVEKADGSIEEEEEGEIKEEYLTDDDREAEKIIKVIHEVADSEVNVPVFGKKRLHPAIIIKKFAQANKEFVEEKYRPLVDKIDSAMGEFANEIFDGMKSKIKAKQEQKMQETYSANRRNSDGNLVANIFGSERFANKF